MINRLTHFKILEKFRLTKCTLADLKPP